MVSKKNYGKSVRIIATSRLKGEREKKRERKRDSYGYNIKKTNDRSTTDRTVTEIKHDNIIILFCSVIAQSLQTLQFTPTRTHFYRPIRCFFFFLRIYIWYTERETKETRALHYIKIRIHENHQEVRKSVFIHCRLPQLPAVVLLFFTIIVIITLQRSIDKPHQLVYEPCPCCPAAGNDG